MSVCTFLFQSLLLLLSILATSVLTYPISEGAKNLISNFSTEYLEKVRIQRVECVKKYKTWEHKVEYIGCLIDCVNEKSHYINGTKIEIHNFKKEWNSTFFGISDAKDAFTMFERCADKVNSVEELKFCHISLQLQECIPEEAKKLKPSIVMKIQEFYKIFFRA